MEMKKRWPLLDTIRGVVLVSMIVYHASWNLVYIYAMEWKWFHSEAAYLWQQSICWTFILLSGFCFSLGKRHIRSGCLVFGGGLLVTLVTCLVMPQNRVVFGVLTCIGSCILLTALGERWLRKLSSVIGMVLTFFLFLLTKNINAGTLGFLGMFTLALPRKWYQNDITAYLGFPFPGFYSTDYFSLVPWIFLFLCGFYLCELLKKRKVWDYDIWQLQVPLLTWMGRHSLLIYLLHQPIIWGIQEIIF